MYIVLFSKMSFFVLISLFSLKLLLSFLQMYDDLDLPFATLRLLPKGGHGGHNGYIVCPQCSILLLLVYHYYYHHHSYCIRKYTGHSDLHFWVSFGNILDLKETSIYNYFVNIGKVQKGRKNRELESLDITS